MGEICQRPSAFNRFLVNRQGDVATRLALENFQRFGVNGADRKTEPNPVLATESIARRVDVAERMATQDLRALTAIRDRKLTPPLVEYAVRHSRRIARLASALG